MPVVNELPQGGGGKWELLWTNPNPNSAISSPITVRMDMTPYERVFVQMKVSNGSGQQVSLVEHIEGSNWIGMHQTGTDTWMAYRWFTHNPTQFSIGADGGYMYHNGSKGTGSQYGIPVAVYGVKRLNLG